MPLFSFRRLEIDPLTVSMTGVKAGERLLQLDVDDAAVAGLLAAKPGLNGSAAHVVATDGAAVKVNRGVKQAGALVEVRVAPLDRVPFDDAAFDVVVIHSVGGQMAAADAATRREILRECRRVVRQGGRVVVIEPGTPTGLKSILRSAPAAQATYDAAGGTPAALREAGFSPVRELGDREGVKFTEALRTA
jgi:ubiquinone/menaquinone biosynthesis C-methylase UbiE